MEMQGTGTRICSMQSRCCAVPDLGTEIYGWGVNPKGIRNNHAMELCNPLFHLHKRADTIKTIVWGAVPSNGVYSFYTFLQSIGSYETSALGISTRPQFLCSKLVWANCSGDSRIITQPHSDHLVSQAFCREELDAREISTLRFRVITCRYGVTMACGCTTTVLWSISSKYNLTGLTIHRKYVLFYNCKSRHTVYITHLG